MDAATGLPELPEGFFWRVENDGVSIRRNREPSDWFNWSYAPSGVSESRERTVKTPWYRRDYTVTEWRRINEADLISIAHTDPILDSDGKAKTMYNPWSGTEHIVRVPIVAENVIPLAEKALALWESIKARRALLGDYPPKKFEVKS